MVLITLILLVIVRLIMGALMLMLLAWIDQGRRRTDLAAAGQQQRMDEIESQMQLFIRLIERSLGGRLRAPNHPYLQALLDKLRDDTLTPHETHTLHRLIQERGDDLVSVGIERPDTEFPKVLTLWSLEARMAMAPREERAVVEHGGAHDAW